MPVDVIPGAVQTAGVYTWLFGFGLLLGYVLAELCIRFGYDIRFEWPWKLKVIDASRKGCVDVNKVKKKDE